MIVDDSAVIRRVLREALAADAEVEVAGVAGDGESALQQIERLKPDVVTLDVELPGMSGLQILKEIRKRWQRRNRSQHRWRRRSRAKYHARSSGYSEGSR